MRGAFGAFEDKEAGSKGNFAFGDGGGRYPFGIAESSGIGGGTLRLILRGVSGVHNGLAAGRAYYGNSNGSRTTDVGDFAQGWHCHLL